MKNNWYKILLMVGEEKMAAHIKYLVKETPLQILFIPVDDLKSFRQKMAWMKPCLIISDRSPEYFEGNDKLSTGIPNLPKTPILFIGALTPAVASEDSRIPNKKATFISPSRLDKIVPNIIRALNSVTEEEKIDRNRNHQIKIQLHKISTILGESPDFSQKKVIEKTLQQMAHSLCSIKVNRQLTL